MTNHELIPNAEPGPLDPQEVYNRRRQEIFHHMLHIFGKILQEASDGQQKTWHDVRWQEAVLESLDTLNERFTPDE